jgi:hypothetical protein
VFEALGSMLDPHAESFQLEAAGWRDPLAVGRPRALGRWTDRRGVGGLGVAPDVVDVAWSASAGRWVVGLSPPADKVRS